MLLKNRSDRDATGIDLTPVIDIVFLLLIFFLVATTFAQQEREMEIALPRTAHSGPISAALREIIINVAADGRLVVSGAQIAEEPLGAMIAAAVEANPAQKVTIRGDSRTNWGRMAQVMDLCRGAGVDVPNVSTVPIE